jgi:hypothetical protein
MGNERLTRSQLEIRARLQAIKAIASNKALRKAKEKAEAENGKLRSRLAAAVKLKDWAMHTPTCSKRRGFRSPPWDCDCGLDEALCVFEMTERL